MISTPSFLYAAERMMRGTHRFRKAFSAAMPTGPAGQAAAVGEPKAPLTAVVLTVAGVVAAPVVVVVGTALELVVLALVVLVLGVVPVVVLVVVVVGTVLVGSVLDALSVIARASPHALGARKLNVAVFAVEDSAAGSLVRSRTSVEQSPRSSSE